MGDTEAKTQEGWSERGSARVLNRSRAGELEEAGSGAAKE